MSSISDSLLLPLTLPRARRAHAPRVAYTALALTQPVFRTAPRLGEFGTAPWHRTCTARRACREAFDDFADRETDELAPFRGWPAPRPSRRRSGASRLRH